MTAALVLYRASGAPLSTQFRAAALGAADPFASSREIAWQGVGGMSAGRLRFEGALDIARFPHQETLVVVQGELRIDAEGAAPLVLKPDSGVVIATGAAVRITATEPTLVVFCAAECPQPVQPGVFPLVAEANFKPSMNSLPKEILLGDVPTCRSDNVVDESSIHCKIGTWDSTPYHRIVRPHPVNEFMHILDGGVRFAEPDGSVVSVERGDAVFVPLGAAIGWESSTRVAKFYVVQSVPAEGGK
ncbi:cupin domain-containing protein [Herbaspirillum sp. DW155]|uniref:cupin domain-containing protein n=1 Tax=Herbaspirillum sp. DW155 TaxID=3095609 RepID=UPI00308661A1|nr:cupin domain-containing protein [Herbaspirillum sp. DW155]